MTLPVSFLGRERALMNRVFIFGWIVAGFLAMGWGSFFFGSTPTVRAIISQKDSPQATDPKKEGSGDAKKHSRDKTLLSPSDFTYVGSYPFSADNQATFGMGLTCRRVKGQLRFLTTAYSGKGDVASHLIEFALPETVGQGINKLTNRWPNILVASAFSQRRRRGPIWLLVGRPGGRQRAVVDDALHRLPGRQGDQEHTGRRSPDSERRWHHFQPQGRVRVRRGRPASHLRRRPADSEMVPRQVRREPALRRRLGWIHESDVQGLVPSLGLMVLAIPDVTTYQANSVIQTKDFKILADHRSGTSNGRDWYASKNPSTFDRGQRNADVVNYFDGGDNRSNPKSAPSAPPIKGAQWLSPAPDGFGRFVWGDSFYNTGCWIDGPNKGGFIVVGSFAKGKAFYQGSTLHNKGRHAELQIFDPEDFGKVLQKKKNPWNVQPTASKLLTKDLSSLDLLFPNSGNNPSGAVAGATFDATTGMLYLWCPGVNGKYGCCLVAYKMNS